MYNLLLSVLTMGLGCGCLFSWGTGIVIDPSLEASTPASGLSEPDNFILSATIALFFSLSAILSLAIFLVTDVGVKCGRLAELVLPAAEVYKATKHFFKIKFNSHR